MIKVYRCQSWTETKLWFEHYMVGKLCLLAFIATRNSLQSTHRLILFVYVAGLGEFDISSAQLS